MLFSALFRANHNHTGRTHPDLSDVATSPPGAQTIQVLVQPQAAPAHLSSPLAWLAPGPLGAFVAAVAGGTIVLYPFSFLLMEREIERGYGLDYPTAARAVTMVPHTYVVSYGFAAFRNGIVESPLAFLAIVVALLTFAGFQRLLDHILDHPEFQAYRKTLAPLKAPKRITDSLGRMGRRAGDIAGAVVLWPVRLFRLLFTRRLLAYVVACAAGAAQIDGVRWATIWLSLEAMIVLLLGAVLADYLLFRCVTWLKTFWRYRRSLEEHDPRLGVWHAWRRLALRSGMYALTAWTIVHASRGITFPGGIFAGTAAFFGLWLLDGFMRSILDALRSNTPPSAVDWTAVARRLAAGLFLAYLMQLILTFYQLPVRTFLLSSIDVQASNGATIHGALIGHADGYLVVLNAKGQLVSLPESRILRTYIAGSNIGP